MSVVIDQLCLVCVEDVFDFVCVDVFFKEYIDGFIGMFEFGQFFGGVFNFIYLLCYGDCELVLCCLLFGVKVKFVYDMLCEVQVMIVLCLYYLYVLCIFVICYDVDVFGCDFYVMEWLVGVILCCELLVDFGLDVVGVCVLCIGFIDWLVELYCIDINDLVIVVFGKGEGYIVWQVVGWSECYC